MLKNWSKLRSVRSFRNVMVQRSKFQEERCKWDLGFFFRKKECFPKHFDDMKIFFFRLCRITVIWVRRNVLTTSQSYPKKTRGEHSEARRMQGSTR